jgi:hypothetical protein
LTDRDEASGKEVPEIKNKLTFWFEEYGKALKEFGVRPAPLPAGFLGLYLVQVISLPLSRLRVS